MISGGDDHDPSANTSDHAEHEEGCRFLLAQAGSDGYGHGSSLKIQGPASKSQQATQIWGRKKNHLFDPDQFIPNWTSWRTWNQRPVLGHHGGVELESLGSQAKVAGWEISMEVLMENHL